jgi:hypothetical protein
MMGTISDGRMVFFECLDCGGERVVVPQPDLAEILERHRREHPDHGQELWRTVVGHVEIVED